MNRLVQSPFRALDTDFMDRFASLDYKIRP